MQVTEKSSEGLKRAFAVVLPAADITARREARLAEIGKDLRLPGFRPGKVPAKIVAQRYGQAVMGEVLERSLDDAARRIVTDRGLKPAVQPKVEIVNWSDGADLEFNLDLELLPEIAIPDLAAIEVEKLTAMQRSISWVDAVRRFIPPEEKLFSWWSYRAQDWAASDRGRRLDHVWSSPNLAPALAGIEVLRDARGWERPSDHVPVIARFDLE